MKTPALLEVPKTHPTAKERLNAFKVRHQIETLAMPGPSDPLKWCAVHLPTARTFGYGVTAESSICDCVAKVGRLLDESGVMGYGHTEREAIMQTCAACNIEFNP